MHLYPNLAIYHLFMYVCNTPLFFAGVGANPWHMEVPRLGVELELQLPAYATTTPDLGSRQRWIPDAMSEARD